MLYVYPPRIINGTLYTTNDLVEYTRGKILQTLSIVRGELVADPFFGVPFRLFSSVNDYQNDVQKIQLILSENIPEADFLAIGSIANSGIFILNIYWSYLGTDRVETFEIDNTSF